MKIRYVENKDIDKTKWNSCVHYANNGNIFGYMWFLDHVAKDWDALVEGDYESVFPLVWRPGIFRGRELYQPDLMREMGIYSINVLSPKRIRRFLDAIPDEYRLVDIAMNQRNRPPGKNSFEVAQKTNHQLLLDRSYEELEQNFTTQIREGIQRATENGLVPASNLKPETIAGFFRKYSTRQKNKMRNFHALQRIMYNVLHRGWGFASGVFDSKGDLCAVDFFIYSHGRVMSLVPVASPYGQQHGAMAYLYSLLIRTHANRPILLDFNTRSPSDLALGFGAQPNSFYQVRKDRRLLGVF